MCMHRRGGGWRKRGRRHSSGVLCRLHLSSSNKAEQVSCQWRLRARIARRRRRREWRKEHQPTKQASKQASKQTDKQRKEANKLTFEGVAADGVVLNTTLNSCLVVECCWFATKAPKMAELTATRRTKNTSRAGPTTTQTSSLPAAISGCSFPICAWQGGVSGIWRFLLMLSVDFQHPRNLPLWAILLRHRADCFAFLFLFCFGGDQISTRRAKQEQDKEVLRKQPIHCPSPCFCLLLFFLFFFPFAAHHEKKAKPALMGVEKDDVGSATPLIDHHKHSGAFTLYKSRWLMLVSNAPKKEEGL